MSTRSRTPETLTAVARYQQLASVIKGSADVNAKSNDDRMMRALTPVRPAPSATAATLRKVYDDADANRTEELDGSIMTLNVEDVHTYDKDVRVGPNPKYEEIKASLLAQGNNHRFSVTRRPGDSRYFVSAGANTRLRIIKELWRQTQDKRWRTVDVVYRVWKNESTVILAHLAENDVRAEITFWERASGIELLEMELRKERGQEVPAAELAQVLKSAGMPRSVMYVNTARFATKYLKSIGQWLEVASTQTVIAPAYRALEKLAGDLGSKEDDIQGVLQDVLADFGEMMSMRSREAAEKEPPISVSLNAELSLLLVERWRLAISGLLETPLDGLNRMLEAQAQSPRIPAETLLAIARGEGVSYPQSHRSLPPPPVGAKAPAQTRAPVAAASPPADTTPAQQPLRPPLIAPVAPAGLQASAGGPTAVQLPAVELPDDIPPNLAAAGAAGVAQHYFLKSMVALTSLVDLDDCVAVHLNSMPLGYVMEPPSKGFKLNSAGQPVEDPYLRRCTWLFLAALSGQHDERAVARLPETTAWRQFADHGKAAQFMVAALADERPGWPSRQSVYAPYVADVLLHPQLGSLAVEMLARAHKLMPETPERSLGDLTQLLPI